MKKLLLAIVATALMGCVTTEPITPTITAEPEPAIKQLESVTTKITGDDIFELRDWLENKPSDSWDEVLQEGQGYRIIERKVVREQNLTGHDNFRWRWDERYISIVMLETEEKLRIAPEIYFTIKQYQELVSVNSRQFVLWNLVEADTDGTVDVWERGYYLNFNCFEDDPLYTFVMPYWPEGFTNPDWGTPPRQEAQDLIDELVTWWLEQSKIIKQGV